MNAAIGGQRTSDKSGGELVPHFGDKCDDGLLNATKRGQGCCAFCVFFCLCHALGAYSKTNYLGWM